MRKENNQRKEATMKEGGPRDDRETTERVASGNGVVTELIAKQKDWKITKIYVLQHFFAKEFGHVKIM